MRKVRLSRLKELETKAAARKWRMSFVLTEHEDGRLTIGPNGPEAHLDDYDETDCVVILRRRPDPETVQAAV